MFKFDTSVPPLGSYGTGSTSAADTTDGTKGGGGTFWASFGSILEGAAPLASALKGNPAAVQNFYGGNDPNNPSPNNSTIWIIGGLLLAGIILFFILKK